MMKAKVLILVIILIGLVAFWGCTKDDSNPSGPGGGTTTDTTELFYDDGTPDTYEEQTVAGTGPAVRFTTPAGTDSFQLIGVKIRLGTTSAGSITFSLRLYNWGTNAPGTEIHSQTVAGGTQDTWNTWWIANQNIYFQANTDFVVGMIYDGTNEPTYGIDNTAHTNSWLNSGGTPPTWIQVAETYFIRVYVRSTTTSDVYELSPNMDGQY
ncbi:MAG: hypothetical protein ACP5FK_05220 [bacterium]